MKERDYMGMVKSIIVVTISLLSLSVLGADNIPPQLDSLNNYASLFWNSTGASTDQMSQARRYFSINAGIQAVCDVAPAIEKIDTLWIATSNVLNSDFNRLASVFRMTNDTLIPLQIINANDGDTLLIKMTQPDFAHDKFSKTSPKMCYVHNGRLHTIPKYINSTIGDTLLINYYANDVKLASGTDSTKVLPKYRMAILYYAIGVRYQMLGLEEMAVSYFNLFGQALMKQSDVKGIIE